MQWRLIFLLTLAASSALRQTTLQPENIWLKLEKTSTKSGWSAWGGYAPKTRSGWGQLMVRTSDSFHDFQQAYAAGFIEGALTSVDIWSLSQTIWSNRIGPEKKQQMEAMVLTQNNFLRSKVQEIFGWSTWKTPQIDDFTSGELDGTTFGSVTIVSSENDYSLKSQSELTGYWYNIGLILSQLDGMMDGYNHVTRSDNQFSPMDFWFLNMDGDYKELLQKIDLSRKSINDMDRHELAHFLLHNGHCSALIKWLPKDRQKGELYVGHATWSGYEELFRTYKHYQFSFSHPSIASKGTSFSSYPGFVWSSDDFLILDTGLVVMETTLALLNEKLYDQINPASSVFAWFRSVAANRMARNGEEWVSIFSKYNSGTYNNQWMVVDYNKFSADSRTLTPGTFWLLEQLPGKIESRDCTDILQQNGYWASYNQPYFESINSLGFFNYFQSVHGTMLSYQNCSRAKIFAREQQHVSSMEDMQRLMRLNRYQTDEFSAGCPTEAIAARGDLPSLPQSDCHFVGTDPVGAIDAKVSRSDWIKSRQCLAVVGPTTDDQMPFEWKSPWRKPSGQPNLFNFVWEQLAPLHFRD